MFKSKYNKILTVILIIAICIIVGLLTFAGVKLYVIHTSNVEIEDMLEQFNGVIDNPNIKNTNIPDNTEVVNPHVGLPTNDVNGSQNKKNVKYKGYNVVGVIEIPKIKLNLPVLEKETPESIKTSVAVMYGPGINEIGNTVIAGHNYRDGRFFSKNKILAVGDKIYLKDLTGKKIKYIISKKFIAAPNESDFMVRDTKGKRGISLITCTDDVKSRLIILAEEA